MQARRAVKYGGWPVAHVVGQEWTASLQLVLEVRELAAAGSAICIILAADRQSDAITRGHHDRARPDLDVEFHRLAFLERLLLVMGVIGAVGLRQLPVELAVRCAQP